MRAWESLQVGDKVTFTGTDGVELHCYISSVHKDHSIAMDYDTRRYWLDADTRLMFRRGWE